MQELSDIPIYRNAKIADNTPYISNFLFFGTELFKTISGKKKILTNNINFEDFVTNKQLSLLPIFNKTFGLVDNYFRLLSKKTDKIGILFSGGIDSTVALVFAKKYFQDNVTCYNFFTKNTEFSERAYVETICSDFGVDCKFFTLNPLKEIKNYFKISKIIREPDQSISPFLLFSVLPHIKEKFIIIGEGSEDSFIEGKDYAVSNYLSKISDDYTFLTLFSKFKAIFPSIPISELSPEAKNFLQKVADSNLTAFQKYNLLRVFVWEFNYIPQSRKIIANHFGKKAVFPFFYKPLFKFLLKVPSEHKLKLLTGRYLLRKFLKGKVSEKNIYRKKMMDVHPMGEWYNLNKDFVDDKIEELLQSKDMSGIKKFVVKDLQEIKPRNVNHYRRIWSLFWLGCKLYG